MEKNLFIFSFKRLPLSIILMLILFISLETVVRLFWDPRIIGEKLYKINPTYDYGYDSQTPLFFKDRDTYICYPRQYCDFYKQSLSIDKKNKEIRIFVFGGSISRGKQGSNYPLMLEHKLNNNLPGKTWRIINLSVDGYGTSRTLILIKKALEYKPDFFIYHIHGSNEYEDERDEVYKAAIDSGMNKILYTSNFVVLAKKAWDYINPTDKIINSNEEDEESASRKTENIDKWNLRIRNNLNTMINIAEEKNIPVILMARAVKNIQKEPLEVKRTIQINNIIKSFVNRKNIYYFDTQEIIHNNFINGMDSKRIFSDETHYTPEGHRFIAEKLAIFFTKEILQ